MRLWDLLCQALPLVGAGALCSPTVTLPGPPFPTAPPCVRGGNQAFQSMVEKLGGTFLCSELDCARLKGAGETCVGLGPSENIHLFAAEGQVRF